MELLGERQKANGLSELRDPFKKDCVENIHFHISKALFYPHEIQFNATVAFVSGPTSGRQAFTAEDFPSLVRKVEEFTNSLKP